MGLSDPIAARLTHKTLEIPSKTTLSGQTRGRRLSLCLLAQSEDCVTLPQSTRHTVGALCSAAGAKISSAHRVVLGMNLFRTLRMRHRADDVGKKLGNYDLPGAIADLIDNSIKAQSRTSNCLASTIPGRPRSAG